MANSALLSRAVSPRLLRDLPRARFGNMVKVQGRSESRSAVGGIINTWSTIPGLESVPAIITIQSPTELRLPEDILENTVYRIALGLVTTIVNPRDRAIDDTGRVFDITGIQILSVPIWTILLARILQIEAEPGT